MLGDFRLLENEEYRAKLVKEALKRANQVEKQQYAKIQQQKSEISQKIAEIGLGQEILNEKDRLNVLPQKPTGNLNTTKNRQNKETADNLLGKQYKEALKTYNTQNAAMLGERMRLLQQVLELKAELDGLEEEEKWLLVSMAIRNQSSLLGFMQATDE